MKQESSGDFQDSQDSEQPQRGSIPTFLTRLFDIMEVDRIGQQVQNEDLSETIGWNSDGQAFVVRNQQLLADKILPKYFKHKNYPSFLRQLNMYNFKKSKTEEGHQKFEHKWFRKEGRNLLGNIKRRNQEEMEDKDVREIPQIVDEIEQFKRAQKELKSEIQMIADSQKQLQSALQLIMQQNETLFQESQQLTQELSNMQQKNQQRFANYSNILTEIVQRLQQEQAEDEQKCNDQPRKVVKVEPTLQSQGSQQQQFFSQPPKLANFQMFQQLKTTQVLQTNNGVSPYPEQNYQAMLNQQQQQQNHHTNHSNSKEMKKEEE